ncbi:TPA: hypothetical protein PFD34_003344 [Vibrio cholerae]|nr:hypothetical protein [Vibrio cholerae]
MNNTQKRVDLLEPHQNYVESIDSQLCKLHIKVLTLGKLPGMYEDAYLKAINHQTMTDKDRELSAIVDRYVAEFGVPDFQKPWLNPYQRQILLAFCDFIDDPLRCHKGSFRALHYCKSIQKGLQERQRITLVKFVTTLFTFSSIETGFIGTYGDEFTPPVYEDDLKMLQGIQHYKIRSRFAYLWKESISKTRYDDCVRMFKSCQFLEIEACSISNADADVIRQELREKGASIEEINNVPRVYSRPAYKYFTDAFFSLFASITRTEHMQKFKARAIEKRIKNKLSLAFAVYSCFGDTFNVKKNKFLSKFKWPQGAHSEPPPDPLYH